MTGERPTPYQREVLLDLAHDRARSRLVLGIAPPSALLTWPRFGRRQTVRYRTAAILVERGWVEYLTGPEHAILYRLSDAGAEALRP